MTITSVDTTKTTDLSAMKEQGRALLDANQVEAAIQVFLRILHEHPDDVESHLILGDCYLDHGDVDAALLFYRQALEHAPDSPEIRRKIQAAESQNATSKDEQGNLGSLYPQNQSTVPTNTSEIVDILQEITSQDTPITEEEVMRAAKLLDEIIHSAYPAHVVAERLDEIDNLLPALLELNIRQARMDRRMDLVDGLQNLLRNINLQRGTRKVNRRNNAYDSSPRKISVKDIRILFVGSDADKVDRRMVLLKQGLNEVGCKTANSNNDTVVSMDHFDIVIAHNPHCETWMMEMLAEAHGAKVPVILSVDRDLEQMPVNHPEYEKMGLGTSLQSKAYAAALLLADMIVVPSEVLGNNFRAAGYPAEVIPEGWPNQDEFWLRPATTHSMLNLGWLGSPGQVEDVFSIKRMIVRVMREFPHVCIVIGGDPDVYRLFDSLPEARRIFLPSINSEDYPYLLRQMDILLVPFRNTPYNRSQSDRLLVEAGALSIPWIGSPIPAHVNWASGGLIANTPDEWHTYLRQLIMDNELRTSIGNAGLEKSATRMMSDIIPQWLDTIQKLLK